MTKIRIVEICAVFLSLSSVCCGSAVPPFTTIFMRTVLDDSTAAAARTTLGLGTGDSPTFAGATITGNSVFGLNSSVFQPTADSATFFQVKDKDGNVFLTGDSVNNKTISNTFDATDEDNVLQIDGTTVLKTGTAANYNFFAGEGVFANDDGQYNIGLGYRAGYYNDSAGGGVEGQYNVYIGSLAGRGIVGGSIAYGNVGIGASALKAIEDGQANVGVGSNALSKCTSGDGNISVGGGLTDTQDGSWNVGIGAQTLNENVAGGSNTAIGRMAGKGVAGNSLNENVFIGRSSAQLVSTGSYNSYIGAYSGYNTSTAERNIYVGYKAGYNQTTNSDRLIIDNQDRGSAALEITNSLIYGIFNATPASQSLRVNAGTFILGNPTHSDADGGGAVLIQGIREDSAGAASVAGQISISHDGAGVEDTKGKVVIATDSGSGLVDGAVVSRGGLSTPQDPNTLGVGDTTFIVESNVMTITGDGGGNTIGTITGAKSGTLLTMIFVDANVTITDTDAHTANTVDLAGSATDFTSADDKTLQIVYDGTSWYETSRSVN